MCVITFFSCFSQEKKTILLFVPEESRISHTDYRLDSIIIIPHPHNCDSIIFRQYDKYGIFNVNVFFKKNDSMYEIRNIFTTDEIPGKLLGHDYIRAFTRKDTTFFYKSKMDLMSAGMGLSVDDSNYTIKKLKDGYETIKQSAIDTTFREIYFYDKDYNIYKYILTQNCDMYVYAKKE